MMLFALQLASQIPRYLAVPEDHPQPIYILYTSKYECPQCNAAESEFYKLVYHMPLQRLMIVDCEDDECVKQFPQLPAAVFTINNVSFHYNLDWSVQNLTEFANVLYTSIFAKNFPTRQAFVDAMDDEHVKNYFVFYTTAFEEDLSNALFYFKTRIHATIFTGEDKIIAYNQGKQYEFIGNIMANLPKVREFVNRHIYPAFARFDISQDTRALMMQNKRFCLIAVEKNSDGYKILKQAAKLVTEWLSEELPAVDEFVFRYIIAGKDEYLISSIGETVPFISVLENTSLNYYVRTLDVYSDNSDAIKEFVNDVMDKKATYKTLKMAKQAPKDDFADDDAPVRYEPSQKARRGADSK